MPGPKNLARSPEQRKVCLLGWLGRDCDCDTTTATARLRNRSGSIQDSSCLATEVLRARDGFPQALRNKRFLATQAPPNGLLSFAFGLRGFARHERVGSRQRPVW